jgi:hypothetical protein
MLSGVANPTGSSPCRYGSPRAVSSKQDHTRHEAGARGGWPFQAVQRIYCHSRRLVGAVGDTANASALACSKGAACLHHVNSDRTLAPLHIQEPFRQPPAHPSEDSCICSPVARSRLRFRHSRPGQLRNRHPRLSSLTALWQATSKRCQFSGSLERRPRVAHPHLLAVPVMSLCLASAGADDFSAILVQDL